MSKIEVSQKVKTLKDSLRVMGSNLLEAAGRFGANKETREILKGQIDNINENFLFVIVGEVNAGKSSFVNALLGSPICATSHEICTQDVQKIVYGETESSVQDAHERVITKTFPADILKEITVVDTPGTNSRELDHQIITERFIPKCNLILFIFQMDNIHVQSAWELFRKIKGHWSKKVVFILTKADRYTPEEIGNYSGILKQYAVNENVESPLVFVTSAKQEMEGQLDLSGFLPIRQYINTDVLKDAALNKIIEDIKVIKKLMADIDSEFTARKSKFALDMSTREKITNIITSKESLTLANIQALTKKCMNTFDANTENTLEELQSGIGFFSFTFKSIKSIFGGETTNVWLEKVNKSHVENLNKDTNLVLEGGTDGLKSDITYMVIGVKEELDTLEDLHIKPTEMFHKIDEKRNEMVHSLKQNLTDFIDKSNVFKGANVAKNDMDYMGVNIAGGVAAIGGALTFITKVAVLDITGGVATGLGLIVAGGIAFTKKGKYIASVRETLGKKREEFEASLSHNLSSYFKEIKTKINDQFTDFDYHLKSEENHIKDYDKMAHDLKNELQDVERKIYN